MSQYKLGVVGGGNMAEAILRGVVRSGVFAAGEIVVSDVSLQRRSHLAQAVGVQCVEDNTVPAGAKTIVLAVKPQVMAAVLEGIASCVAPDALIVSIAAGITTGFIDRLLGGKGRIVRVMPNTPMLVGLGMAALAGGPRAGQADLEAARKIFAGAGKTCFVREEQLDAVTAVSGSGPAYFFYLVEAMIEAGVADGLEPQTAALLAMQTFAGAAKLLEESADTPQSLRAKVTSPGGTTQRAIETMEAAGVKAALVKAVRAAAARSKELGK